MTDPVQKLTIFVLFFVLSFFNLSFAQTQTLGQIERSQEILEKERVLRERLERGEKVFIKKITFSGATLISEDKIKEILLPFKNRWLTQAEIQAILDLIATRYKEEGYAERIASISYQINKNRLKIIIEEKEEEKERGKTKMSFTFKIASLSW
ncbi:MAG: hypothetical protein HZA27_03300 [Candidatus Omnitrophica bacterium]|nr:hypothetical protein [Candidatus Omnitrophota bacterium]